ncbi:RNA polymerase sigma factor [Fibrella arboris]|uniref:RNA polymerase sigma factor n=1 Tax=Fibrella arboris TaxID=3242486 RepID=UPI00352226E5
MQSARNALINETDDSDEDLLVIISMKEEVEARQQSFDEFYRRYSPFLWDFVCRIGQTKLDEAELKDIFNRTFINVYEYSGSFDAQGEKEPELIQKKIRGWLARIVKREVQNVFTNGRFISSFEIELYQKMVESSKDRRPTTTFQKEILSEALAQLSDREQHILLTYWEYHELGQGNQSKNMPINVLEGLCQRYDTSKANIRQIIHRSYEKVEQYIKSHLESSLAQSHAKRK